MFDCVEMACYGHDLIEDARVTYNDIKDKVGIFVADLIYCCTEEKGRNRDERHSDRYYQELSMNKTAIFVKLCDIMANLTYSILTNSDMYKNQVKEYPKMRAFLWFKEFEEMFMFLDKLFALNSGQETNL
jgi:(p)ppGpp synthase/HD superfamily hydrolase